MKKIVVISILAILIGCNADDTKSKYLRWVGDSKHDPAIDTTAFELCNSENAVKQYFYFEEGLKYKGEKKELETLFKKEYESVEISQSGLIRIRFIVNCKGEVGRLRLISSDFDYQEQTFDSRITNQLLRITQSLEGWKLHSSKNRPLDYYQYLIFKIDNGSIIDIMP